MITLPTFIKIDPWGENSLPITQYDRIAIATLDVGTSGIETCIMKMGKHEIRFSAGNYKHKDILSVNGHGDVYPVYDIKSTDKNILIFEFPNWEVGYKQTSDSLPLQEAVSQNQSLVDIELKCYLHSSKYPLEVPQRKPRPRI